MNDLTLALTFSFFALGTVVGSFISMLNYRLKHKIGGKITGRSFCPHCKVQIKGYDMIPLLSYVFLGGKCRSCNKSISTNYFFTELITGFLFAFAFLNLGLYDPSGFDIWTTLLWLAIFAIGSAIFFFDLKYLEIHPAHTIAFTLLCLISGYVLVGNSTIEILAGGLIGKLFFYAQYALSKGKWVGLGDSDIGLAMGLLLGPQFLAIALMIAYILGSVVGISMLATKKANRKTQLPFGPFLITGLYITVLFGNQIADWYFNLSF